MFITKLFQTFQDRIRIANSRLSLRTTNTLAVENSNIVSQDEDDTIPAFYGTRTVRDCRRGSAASHNDAYHSAPRGRPNSPVNKNDHDFPVQPAVAVTDVGENVSWFRIAPPGR